MKNSPFDRDSDLRFGLKMAGLLAVLLAFWVAAGQIARTQDDMVDGDFFSFWLAGRMQWTGENPYDEEAWIQGHHAFGSSWISDPVFLYPLPLATLFAPLGRLALGQAARIWVFGSLVMLCAVVLLLMSTWEGTTRREHLLPVLAGVMLFRPVMVTLRNGQLGALLLFLLALILVLWVRQSWFTGGLLLPLLALKPGVGLPLVGLSCLYLVLNRKWPALTGAALSGLGLLVLGWLRDPGWLEAYLDIGQFKMTATLGHHPTLWGIIGTFVCGQDPFCSVSASLVISALLAVGVLAVIHRSPWRDRPDRVLAVIVPAALLVTPYLWVYDQALLVLTLVIGTRELIERRAPFLFSATLTLQAAVISLLLTYVASLQGTDVLSALVPFLALLLVAGLGLWQRGESSPRILREAGGEG